MSRPAIGAHAPPQSMNERSESMKDLFETLAGKSVLVTGGTGSFGSAFVRAALRHGSPAKLVVFSRDEQKHYRLSQEIQDPRLRFFVGDVRDRSRLTSAFRQVDVVIHAAAMKHVPICEYNPFEAVRTNIHGTSNLIEAALEARIPRVIALSSDKAVSPVNLYGATKLAMERLLIASNAYSGDISTRFSLVRYGNVVGSAGSVVPLFERQRKTGEITITDERMTRFWISMDEAIRLVLRGLSRMKGGEVFIPKLAATDIGTLAEAVAPGVPRRVVGIRPGEKLHEQLIAPEEVRRTRDLGDVLVITPEFPFHGATFDEGTDVPLDFYYSSDHPDLRIDASAAREMLVEAGVSP